MKNRCDTCNEPATRVMTKRTSAECADWFHGEYCNECFLQTELAMRVENRGGNCCDATWKGRIPTMAKLRLWITVTDEKKDKARLEAMGIKVGKFHLDPHSTGTHGTPGRGDYHDCEVSEEAFKELHPTWGKSFIWGPMPGQQL